MFFEFIPGKSIIFKKFATLTLRLKVASMLLDLNFPMYALEYFFYLEKTKSLNFIL